MNRHDSTRFSEEFANSQFNKDATTTWKMQILKIPQRVLQTPWGHRGYLVLVNTLMQPEWATDNGRAATGVVLLLRRLTFKASHACPVARSSCSSSQSRMHASPNHRWSHQPKHTSAVKPGTSDPPRSAGISRPISKECSAYGTSFERAKGDRVDTDLKWTSLTRYPVLGAKMKPLKLRNSANPVSTQVAH